MVRRGFLDMSGFFLGLAQHSELHCTQHGIHG